MLKECPPGAELCLGELCRPNTQTGARAVQTTALPDSGFGLAGRERCPESSGGRLSAVLLCTSETEGTNNSNEPAPPMPIPKLNGSGLVPPCRQAPTRPEDAAPYETTMLEICREFGGTPERRRVLAGLLELRAALRVINPGSGFQWVAGEFFVPDSASRPHPACVSVVTFCQPGAGRGGPEVAALARVLRCRRETLRRWLVDHVPVLLSYQPHLLVRQAHGCAGMLGHQRGTGAWQGVLCVDLGADDSSVVDWLLAAAPAAAVGV